MNQARIAIVGQSERLPVLLSKIFGRKEEPRNTAWPMLPGNIITEGLRDLGEDYLRTMAASIPLGQLGKVEDVGHAVLFLASAKAGYITGQTLIVDGGQILPESLEALKSA